MKNFLLLLGLIVATFIFIRVVNDQPIPFIKDVNLDNPVYAEMRINASISGRNFKMVLYGKMASREECLELGRQTMMEMFKGCPFCEFQGTKCLKTATARIENLFNNVPTHLSYASMTRNKVNERDGRAIVWGASVQESKYICKSMIEEVKKNYSGKAVCINP
ncbi:MAG: hypothetical protein PVG20_06500 [Thioalkalispiraceae bacterium]|jgi:hypothetical protein